jgi:hypothetical protein
MNELTETEVETVANSVEDTLYSNTVTAEKLGDYCIQLEQIANSSTALIKIFRQLQAAKLAGANK